MPSTRERTLNVVKFQAASADFRLWFCCIVSLQVFQQYVQYVREKQGVSQAEEDLVAGLQVSGSLLEQLSWPPLSVWVFDDVV